MPFSKLTHFETEALFLPEEFYHIFNNNPLLHKVSLKF